MQVAATAALAQAAASETLKSYLHQRGSGWIQGLAQGVHVVSKACNTEHATDALVRAGVLELQYLSTYLQL